ncbi:hypothetical protein AAY473_010376 [Plecturocebus cupreus]
MRGLFRALWLLQHPRTVSTFHPASLQRIGGGSTHLTAQSNAGPSGQLSNITIPFSIKDRRLPLHQCAGRFPVSQLSEPVKPGPLVCKVKEDKAGHSGSYFFGGPRWADRLKSGVQDHPGQHGKTLSLLKIHKLARHGGTHLLSQLLGRLRQENHLNLGSRDYSEPRSRHYSSLGDRVRLCKKKNILAPAATWGHTCRTSLFLSVLQHGLWPLLMIITFPETQACPSSRFMSPHSLETGSCYLAQVSLKFLASSDPPCSTSQSTGVIGVSHEAWTKSNMNCVPLIFLNPALPLMMAMSPAVPYAARDISGDEGGNRDQPPGFAEGLWQERMMQLLLGDGHAQSALGTGLGPQLWIRDEHL